MRNERSLDYYGIEKAMKGKKKKDIHGEICMKGYAKREVPCDVMEIRISFETRGKCTSDVVTELDDNCEKFLAAFKEQNFDLSAFRIFDDEVRQHFGSSPIPPWLRRDNDSDGYNDNKKSSDIPYVSGSKDLSITVPFNMKLRNFIDKVIAENDLHATVRTEYEVSNREEIEEELQGEAIVDSRIKAEAMAKSAGAQIIGIRSINKNDVARREIAMCCCAKASDIETAPRLLDEVKPEVCVLSETADVVWYIK